MARHWEARHWGAAHHWAANHWVGRAGGGDASDTPLQISTPFGPPAELKKRPKIDRRRALAIALALEEESEE